MHSQKHYLKLLSALALLICFNLAANGQNPKQELPKKMGRGEISLNQEILSIEGCMGLLPAETSNNFEFSFRSKAGEGAEQAQLWSSFQVSGRNDRYALGLRGGMSNDLYLVKYQHLGKDKLLALQPLDFQVSTKDWYDIKIVYTDGLIQVYLNDSDKPLISVKDKEPLANGHLALGGGWLPAQFKDTNIKKLSKAEISKYKALEVENQKVLANKEELRKKQRKAYKGIKVKIGRKARTEVSLNGDWLFIPEHELSSANEAYAPVSADQNWHVMEVPKFWNPSRNWLHGQESGLPHWGSGISDTYERSEINRCEAYTFDYTKTDGAWYRQWVDIKELESDQKAILHFDAVSKVCEVYVNGMRIGEHIGMFGEFEFDITEALKEGKNLIAVHVQVRLTQKSNDADTNIARAVSVDITNDMIKSLPYGMYDGSEGGIWQGVKLEICDQVRLEDVFANVDMNGGSMELEFNNYSSQSQERSFDVEIIDQGSGKRYFKSERQSLKLNAGQVNKALVAVNGKTAKKWSPERPNMYKAIVRVYVEDEPSDIVEIDFGFRSIKAVGDHFELNGLPYWMRGANHPPCGIAPNNVELANKFMKLMHDGNQMVTRAHGAPFTEAWFDAADKNGVGVSNEGSWPWMMISEIPSEELIDIWKEETLAMVKKYRNHPSLLVWTMNNEMYFTMFYHNDPVEVRRQKWLHLSEVIKEVRKMLPGIPISADSGYDRLDEDYEKNLKPYGIDDGDLDDRHIYFNWYNRDFFQIYDGEWHKRQYWTPGANPDRPFFAQEVSTGYPNNDQGHFTRKYIFKHYVPHAWVGQNAWEDHDPAIGLERHGFMTKELCETIRRTTPRSGGILLFANVAWYQNVTDVENIKPYPVYEDFKTAMQPVLVSAELYGRSYFSGEQIKANVYVVNHDTEGKNLDKLELRWSITNNGQTLKSGKHDFVDVKHFSAEKNMLSFAMPETLPEAMVDAQLELELYSNGKQVSANSYDIKLAEKSWYKEIAALEGKKIGLFDPTGATEKAFDKLGVPYFKLRDLTQIRTAEMDLLVVANIDQQDEVPYNWEDVRNVAKNGLPTLLIHPGKHMQWLMFDRVEDIYERKGRLVQMEVPEHPVFDDIATTELAWWQQQNRERPRACRRSFRFSDKEGLTPLAYYLRPHVYIGDPVRDLPGMMGIPLAEINENGGKLITSEMELNQADNDPVAAKLLINLLSYLLL